MRVRKLIFFIFRTKTFIHNGFGGFLKFESVRVFYLSPLFKNAIQLGGSHAQRTFAGIEIVNIIRKGQLADSSKTTFKTFCSLVA